MGVGTLRTKRRILGPGRLVTWIADSCFPDFRSAGIRFTAVKTAVKTSNLYHFISKHIETKMRPSMTVRLSGPEFRTF